MGKKRREPVPAEPLFPLIDGHTHLDSCGGNDPDGVHAVMDRAEAVGVAAVVTVGCHIRQLEAALMAAETDRRVWAALAQHPMDAHEIDDAGRERLAELVRHPRVVAVGECGLDYYWLHHDPENTATQEQQEELFRWHIDLAKEIDKPLMIHARDADEDLIRIIDEAGAPEKTIIHCFSSGLEMAHQCIDRGFYATFGGSTTFKANEELREVVRIFPRDRIMVETDAPYLTPEPFRAAKNEPQYVAYTAYRLAEVTSLTPAEFAELTTRNACRVYGIPFPEK